MFHSLFQKQSRQDLFTVFSTSPLGTSPANILDTFRTPGIQYISGAALRRCAWWIPQVVQATQNEQHLLTKTSAELRAIAEEGYIIIAVDAKRNHLVVGCIVLWDLTENHKGWIESLATNPLKRCRELGTLWVKPEYRFHGDRHMPIADALYRRILADNQSENILATTTNPAAVHLGMRHGMQMIPFHTLPEHVHKATCVCPQEKTGAKNNMLCPLKDKTCYVRVPFPTWQRMGKPQRSTNMRLAQPS